MKKIISLVMTAIFMLSLMSVLTACSGNDAGAETTPPAAETPTVAATTESNTDDDKITLGVTFNNVSGDSYQTAFYEALLEEAETRGYELVVLDAAGDADLQINQVDNLMGMNVDVMMVFPCNGTSIIPALKKANEAGFKTLIINNDIDISGKDYVCGFVGPDCVQQGRDAAQCILDYYADSGKEEIKIIQIEHVPGNMTAVQRGQGFAEGIEGTNATIIESQTANNSREEAMQITENYLIKYPNPGDIDAIFIQGDDMAHGVMAAVDAAGRKGEFPIVGVAITAESWTKMESGLMWGSSLQSPYLLAGTVMDTVEKILADEEIEYYNAMPNPIITPDNMDEYSCPDW